MGKGKVWTQSLGLIAALAIGGDAFACRGPHLQDGVFFDKLPSGLDAPFIAKVTVTEMSTSLKKYEQAAIARVDEIVKGTIDSPSIKLVVMPTSCGPYLRVGNRGIVMGTPTRDAQGHIELRPIQENMKQQWEREKLLQGKNP